MLFVKLTGCHLDNLGNVCELLHHLESIEKREKTGSLTLKSLEEAGRALNMKLVYGFVPMDGVIEKSIENRARELAIEIVRTNI